MYACTYIRFIYVLYVLIYMSECMYVCIYLSIYVCIKYKYKLIAEFYSFNVWQQQLLASLPMQSNLTYPWSIDPSGAPIKGESPSP